MCELHFCKVPSHFRISVARWELRISQVNIVFARNKLLKGQYLTLVHPFFV